MASRKNKILIGIGVALAVLIGLGIAFGGSKEDADAYSWDRISKGDIRETISASGEIQAKTRVNVGTNVAGEIKAIHVVDGQEVKAGDLLVTIDQIRLQQEMARAAAALDGAKKDADRLKASMDRAEQTFARQENLFNQGLISDEDFRQAKLIQQSAQLTYQGAGSNIAQSKASLGSMRDNLSKTTLRAPIDGRITSLKAEKGEMAIPGMSNLPGATLMIISDMHELVAEVKVNESEVVRVKPGQVAQVTVESLQGRVFTGKVAEVATGSEGTGTNANMYKVKVAVDMSAKDVNQLRPGMSARAVILTSEVKNVLRVPLQAVLERDGSMEEAQKQGLLAPTSHSVAMVVKDGKTAEKVVQTGIANTQYFEVKSGLNEGDKVLTGPIRKLKDLKDRASVKLKVKSDTELEEALKKRKAGSEKK